MTQAGRDRAAQRRRAEVASTVAAAAATAVFDGLLAGRPAAAPQGSRAARS